MKNNYFSSHQSEDHSGQKSALTKSQQPLPEKSGQFLRCLPLIAIILVVGTISILTMPVFYYPGDNYAPRMESAYLVSNGEWGIPYSFRHNLDGYDADRGQYLYENDAKQRFFSKYGFGYTISYLIPTFAEKLYKGNVPVLHESRSFMLFLNIFQVLLVIAIALYLKALISLFIKKIWIHFYVIFGVLYGTYVWHYLRSPTLEIFQILPFIASSYHLLKMIRLHRGHEHQLTSYWQNASAAIIFSCFGILFREIYALQTMIVLITTLCLTLQGRWSWKRFQTLLSEWRLWVFYFLVPVVFISGLYFFSNAFRYGSPLESGYQQWIKNGVIVARFDLAVFPAAIQGLFLNIKSQYNVFVYYPLLIAGLIGIRLFFRRFSLDAFVWLVIVLLNLTPLLFLPFWSGTSCNGPRYEINVLILTAIPAGILLENISNQRRLYFIPVFAVSTLVLLISSYWVWNMNSVHYFDYYYVRPAFSEGPLKDNKTVQDYFESKFHRGMLYRDIRLHALGEKEFPPYSELKQLYPEQSPYRDVILQYYDSMLKDLGKPNYWFFE